MDQVKQILKKQKVDGWLLYDFESSNHIARSFLKLGDAHISRRIFYWIPAEGEPTLLISEIESHLLDDLPGNKRTYVSTRDLQDSLEEILHHSRCICMEYSPDGAIPYLSKVDAGTLEMVRACDVSVISSAFLLQEITSTMTDEQISSHVRAADNLQLIVNDAWSFIAKHRGPVYERDVSDFILDELKRKNMVTEGRPICAVGRNSSSPHYSPVNEGAAIGKDDWVLIDLWGREASEGAIFADITRMGCGREPTEKEKLVFNTVRDAQKEAIEFVMQRYEAGEIVKGFEVDEIAREHIKEVGLGQYFTHRTGHNIHTRLHGHGAHLDGFETVDDRPLIPRTCFSVEPGIYIPSEFGVRLETDVLIDGSGNISVTGGLQESLAKIK
ncbi:MAG: M24 family metallopeptidase [Simkaniaceae bacterium]|nr:M24 family metallopeptidase [Simkaniaceae bacterium]